MLNDLTVVQRSQRGVKFSKLFIGVKRDFTGNWEGEMDGEGEGVECGGGVLSRFFDIRLFGRIFSIFAFLGEFLEYSPF